MAEKVVVRGGGSIDGAEFGNAATEATLLRLLDAFKGKKDGASGEEAKLKELANRALKTNTGLIDESSTSQSYANKNISGMSTAAKTATSSISKLGELGSTLASGVFSLAVSAGTQFVKLFTDSLDAFRETSSVGASFNNDLIQLRVAAANAAMPLDEFTSMVGKNSKLMGALGGTVTQGATAFANMSKEIRTSDFGQQMQGLGMTTGDINDYLSGYLEIQQRSGKLNKQIGDEERAGAQAYMVEMDKLTKVTGVSRQQSQDALRTAMKDGRSLNLASKLSGQALANFQAGLTLMNTTMDPAAVGSLTNMMSGVIDPGDRFAKMLSQASPGIMGFQRALGKGELSVREQIAGYKEQESAIGDYLSGFSEEQIARDANLKQLKEYQASLAKYKEMNIEQAEAEQASKNEITTAMGSMRQIFDNIIGKMTSAFLTGDTFKKIQAGLTSISEKFLQYAPKIGDMFANLITDIDGAFNSSGSVWDGLSSAFAKLFDKITPIVSNLFKSLLQGMMGGDKTKKKADLQSNKSALENKLKNAGGFNSIDPKDVAALNDINDQLANIDSSPMGDLSKILKDMFPILEPIQKVISGISWAFDHWKEILIGGGLIIGLTSLTGLLGGASTGLGGVVVSLGKGIGELISSIGKGLGTAIGGLMSGLSTGLLAMANPAILIGAGILSGSIIAIGAGIAGATWIMGKALPTFAEGMKPFQELDGGNLLKVGAGIGAIGAAIAAMGVGSAVGGIGSMLGGLADGISSLFGSKTPFDKLQEFSKLNIDSERIKYNADGVVAFSTAMAALGAGGAVSSLGSLVSNLIGGITTFFGGEQKMPWDKLLDFQKLVFDGEKIRKNAESLAAFAGAMKNLPTIPSETTGGLMGAIGSFFSGSQVMPWDRLKEFGDVKLDGEKIRKNAEILGLFGDSIKTFQSSGTSITSIGADFASQASGVNTFTESIKTLNKAIIDLNSSLATIAKAGTGLMGGGKSNLEVVSQALGGGANTGSAVASEKLNTLVTELVSLTKEIKDSSKDQADALTGRRSAL